MESLVVLFLLAVAAFQAWVSYRVARSKYYEREQKSAQLAFIWMLPALGAVIAFMMLRSIDEYDRPSPQSDRQDQR